MADCEQSQLFADDNLRAFALHRARMSLLSLKPMAGDRQDPTQGNPYKGVEHLAHFVSPVEIELARDPRIRGVWQELYRQRADGTFVYPVRDAWWEQRRYMGGLLPAGALAAADADERQNEALLELFDTMLACKLLPIATTTRREAEQQRNRYLTMAHELELAAKAMRENPDSPIDKRHERWRRLKEAAKICTDYAHEIHAVAMWMAPLDRKHDGRARGVALTIANKLHELFGKAMYGLTATITSVVLGRTVDPRRVRQSCRPHRSHPADLGSKTTPKPHPTLQIWAQKRP